MCYYTTFLCKGRVPRLQDIFPPWRLQYSFTRKHVCKEIVVPPDITFLFIQGTLEFSEKQMIHTNRFCERAFLDKFLNVYHDASWLSSLCTINPRIGYRRDNDGSIMREPLCKINKTVSFGRNQMRSREMVVYLK